jgi:hypothetical protein
MLMHPQILENATMNMEHRLATIVTDELVEFEK